MRCEDFPCCGHGPPPLGDDGGCPDENGCFNCVLCSATLPKESHSSICDTCIQSSHERFDRDASGPYENEES